MLKKAPSCFSFFQANFPFCFFVSVVFESPYKKLKNIEVFGYKHVKLYAHVKLYVYVIVYLRNLLCCNISFHGVLIFLEY